MPMRCTGEAFLDIIQQEMPDKLVHSYTGRRYAFGARGAIGLAIGHTAPRA